MSDLTQEVDSAVPEEAAADVVEETTADDSKKAVKFEANELTFDEAQAEIDAIKARAGQARENLRSSPAVSSSYQSSYSSYSAPASYEDEVPKSKNMLSHLNSNSAMISYKVTTARNLVQKQEALLRNLKLMRENMERSSVEISRASDYLSPVRPQHRGYFEKRAESAPLISRRQVRDVSPIVSYASNVDEIERISEKASSPAPISFSSRISSFPTPVSVSTTDYQPDPEFEKEMAAIRKRVSDLTSKASEVVTPRYSSYAYDLALSTTPMGRYTTDLYPEPKIEVKNVRTPKYVPKTLSLPPRTVHVSQHATADTNSYPHNSYTDYLMESLNNLDTYPTNASLDLNQLYTDPLVTTDYSVAY